MKVLVTGGSGFIGSHVADHLTECGHSVRILDIRQSPYIQKGQEMFLGDLQDKDLLGEAVKGCDVVYHFAGLADLDDASTRPLDTVRDNVMGTVRLLDVCRESSVRRFVYASSLYVYSNKGGFYRCSKQAAETYIHEYKRRYDLDFTILRFGTLYGPRADRRNSVWRYLYNALREGKIVGNGTGDEMREYIHVKDAARLSVEVLDEKYANEHITITGHHPIKYKQLLEMINEIMGGNVSISFNNMEDMDHYSLTPYSYIPKIGQKLVSNYYVDMGQGLLECIQDIEGAGGDNREGE
jgi:UDP-glucose 4-epimerase